MGLILPPPEPDHGGDWRRLLRLWWTKTRDQLDQPWVGANRRLLRDLAFTSVLDRYPHGLGAVPAGYLVLNLRAPAPAALVLYNGTSGDENLYLYMFSTAACTADILVWS